MRRMTTMVVLLAAVVLIAALAASSKGSATAATTATTGKPVTITVWLPFGPELSLVKPVIDEYDAKHPEVTIKTLGNIGTTKVVAGIRSGNGPDVAADFDSTTVGTYCPSGGFIDLAPYLKRDHIDINNFAPAPRYYTQYQGKRCALPMLADTFGLYYNKALFKKAGIAQPPRTISELTADAKKLTERKPDGSLKVVGFDPFIGFYSVTHDRLGALYGAKWTDAAGHSTLGKDPQWAKMLRWEKGLIDWYGYSKLVRFQSGLGQEFSASNAFEKGQLAMNLDGEWRVAFIKRESPNLDYGTAPMPVDDAHPELYGSENLNGTIIGIPKTSKHKDEAWALVKYLTTNDHALAELANGLGNVPTTKSSLRSPELKLDPRFKVFLKIYANPHSSTFPITAAGTAYQSLFTNFITKWQAGHVSDLAAGLKTVDKQIDEQLAAAKKGGTP